MFLIRNVQYFLFHSYTTSAAVYVFLLSSPVIECSKPEALAHGSVQGSSFVYRSNVKYSCMDGFELVGNLESWCLASGQWSSSTPTCSPVQCSRLVATRHSSLNTTNHTYSSVVEVLCDLGYTLPSSSSSPVSSVSSTTVCLSSGVWSRTLAKCQVIECAGIVPASSVQQVSIVKTYGGNAVWKCASGFVKTSGNEIRSCQAGGTWSGTELACRGKEIVTRRLESSCFEIHGMLKEESIYWVKRDNSIHFCAV